MSLRETINDRKGLGVVIGVVLIAAAVGSFVVAHRQPAIQVEQLYYSIDDGATFFAEDANRIYPFDHNGQPAYRVYVYRCGDGQPFVSYLARYNDRTRTRLEQLIAKGSPDDVGEIARLRGAGIEVKKPGDKEWVALDDPAAAEILSGPACPQDQPLRAVLP